MAPRRRQRRSKPFRATKEVKRRARIELGTPPPTRRQESLKGKLPKHKKQSWAQENEW
jgi:hypothetical protein